MSKTLNAKISIYMWPIICFLSCMQLQAQEYDEADMDSLHGIILKPGISLIQKPENMFQLNCYNCHTDAIDLYVRHYFKGDTSLLPAERFIHTWLICTLLDSIGEIHIQAMGINSLYDTIPVRTALLTCSIKQGNKWTLIDLEPIITDTAGRATFNIPLKIVSDKTRSQDFLVKLLNEQRYPNGKNRIKIHANTEKQVFSNSSFETGNYSLTLRVFAILGAVTLVILGLIGYAFNRKIRHRNNNQ